MGVWVLRCLRWLILKIVTDVSETTVTFDANHPLAGQTLIFDIELVDVET